MTGIDHHDVENVHGTSFDQKLWRGCPPGKCYAIKKNELETLKSPASIYSLVYPGSYSCHTSTVVGTTIAMLDSLKGSQPPATQAAAFSAGSHFRTVQGQQVIQVVDPQDVGVTSMLQLEPVDHHHHRCCCRNMSRKNFKARKDNIDSTWHVHPTRTLSYGSSKVPHSLLPEVDAGTKSILHV